MRGFIILILLKQEIRYMEYYYHKDGRMNLRIYTQSHFVLFCFFPPFPIRSYVAFSTTIIWGYNLNVKIARYLISHFCLISSEENKYTLILATLASSRGYYLIWKYIFSR